MMKSSIFGFICKYFGKISNLFQKYEKMSKIDQVVIVNLNKTLKYLEERLYIKWVK